MVTKGNYQIEKESDFEHIVLQKSGCLEMMNHSVGKYGVLYQKLRYS